MAEFVERVELVISPARYEAFKAINTEIAYAEKKWGDSGRKHEIASWIAYLEHHLQEARRLASTNSPETVALHEIRKVAALAVRCMSEHGAPLRD